MIIFTHMPTNGRLSTSSMKLPIHIDAMIPQKSCRLFGDHRRAGLDALNDHRADHQRHHGIGRDAPRVNIGINEVCAPALFAASGAATPSMAPLPNWARFLETFFSIE